jgi:plastocyanin
MMRRATASFICLCLAVSGGLALSACGDDSSSSSKKSSKKKSSKKTPTAQAGTVTMQNITFEPNNLSVKVNDTVTWTNDESVAHDVTADDGSFKSGPSGGMKQGDTYKHAFAKAGSFAYKCTVHPNMTGTVEVTN